MVMKEAPLITMNSPIRILIEHSNYVHFNDTLCHRNTAVSSSGFKEIPGLQMWE